jgi:hypothetical protein
MPPSILTRLRRSKDARSVGRALALLFILTGLIGSLASGAAAAPTENGLVHCISGHASDAGKGVTALPCCTLGCPMVVTAAPVPVVPGLVLPTLPSSPVGAGRLAAAISPPAILLSGESPRGPPFAL